MITNLDINLEYLEEKSLSEDELIVRELLNRCSQSVRIPDVLDMLPKLKARHFIMAFKDIDGNMTTINDMSIFEYLIPNILSTPEDDMEDDIYV